MADYKNEIITENQGEIIIYQTNEGNTKIDVRFVDETVWLTQAQLCELYQTSKSNISEHIKHIFEEGELEEISVVRKFRTTAADGKNYTVTHYNLDMIISLGYRVKSIIATKFRRWATERLKEYMLKGFTIMEYFEPINETSYLSVPNAPVYRKIMRCFYREYEKMHF